MTEFIHALYFTVLVIPTMVWMFLSLILKKNKLQWIATIVLFSLLYYNVVSYYDINVFKWDWL
jgi:uncharacterized membrane protein